MGGFDEKKNRSRKSRASVPLSDEIRLCFVRCYFSNLNVITMHVM